MPVWTDHVDVVPIPIKKHASCMYPGYYGDPERECTCSLQNRDPLPKTHLRSHARPHRYPHRSPACLHPKQSGAERSGVDFEKLSDNRRGESSDDIRARVEAARHKQRERFAGLNNGVMTNADMRVADFVSFAS